MIIVEPNAGLCNRMRSIASAFYIAKQTKQKLIIIWPISKDCYCKFEDLFVRPEEISIYNINSRILNMTRGMLKKNLLYIDDDGNGTEHIIYQTIENKRSVYIKSCYEFSKILDYSLMKPNKRIEEQSLKILPNATDVIGIHIRRKDNIDSIINSPLNLFIDKLSNEIKLNSSSQFFLATDSYEEQDKILRSFNDRILYNKTKHNTRRSVKGMRDACVDLFCLSRCKKIYGSFWSSFSIVASEWNGGKELIIVKE